CLFAGLARARLGTGEAWPRRRLDAATTFGTVFGCIDPAPGFAFAARAGSARRFFVGVDTRLRSTAACAAFPLCVNIPLRRAGRSRRGRGPSAVTGRRQGRLGEVDFANATSLVASIALAGVIALCDSAQLSLRPFGPQLLRLVRALGEALPCRFLNAFEPHG